MSKQSVKAFLENIRTGQLKSKQDKIFVYLSGKRLTLQQMREELTYPHQTLTSALSRLMDMGVISQDDDGRFYHTMPNEIEVQSMLRQQERYNRWVKTGHENGWFQPNGTPKPPQPRRVVLSKQLSILDAL